MKLKTILLQILEKDNKEVVKSEKEESDTLFLKHYVLKSTRWRKFKCSIKHLIERKVFSSTKNKNKNEWNIQK